MNTLKNNLLNRTIKPIVAIAVIAFVACAGAATIQAAWNPPTQAAPLGNTNPPINDSSTGQVKSGGLSVGSLIVNGSSILGGSLAIGGGAPAYELDIKADDTLAIIRLANTSTGTGSADGSWLYQGGNNLVLRNREAAGSLAFYTADTERARFNPSGAFVVGATSATAGLLVDVEGNIGAQLYCDEAGLNCIDIENIVSSTSTAPGSIGFWTEAGSNVYRTTGNVGIGTAAPTGAKLVVVDGAAGYNPEAIIQTTNGAAILQLSSAVAVNPIKLVAGLVNGNDFSIHKTDGIAGSLLYISDTGDIGVGDTTPDGTLKFDVEGQVGATEYCDSDGLNCTPAANLGGGLWSENGTDVYRASGGVAIGLNSTAHSLETAGDIVSGGRIFGANGGPSTPTYSFDSDTNTGIYGTGSDEVRIATAGALRARFANNGNVGFGTHTPAAALDVRTSISGEEGLRVQTVGGSAENSILTYHDGALKHNFFISAGNAQLRMYQAGGGAHTLQMNGGGLTYFNGGDVAIGSTAASGALVLDVTGAVGADNYCDSAGGNCFTAASVGSGGADNLGNHTATQALAMGGFAITGASAITTSGVGTFNGGVIVDGDSMINGAGNIHTAKSVSAAEYGYFEALDSSGNRGGYFGFGNGGTRLDLRLEDANTLYVSGGGIGIGDSTLDGGLELDVNGQIGADNYCDSNGANCFTAAGVGGGSSLWSNGTGSDIYYTAGEVGIGTSNPLAPLHVVGNIYLGTVNSAISKQGSGDINLQTNTGDLVFSTLSGTPRMTIESGGDVGIGTTNPSSKLHVVGSATFSSNITASTAPTAGAHLTNKTYVDAEIAAAGGGGGGGDITAVTAGTGITGGGTSGAVTLNAQTTTALWNANQLQGRSVATTAPSSGQVLKWNGSSWAPGTDNNSGGGGGGSLWTDGGATTYINGDNIAIGKTSAATELDVDGDVTADAFVYSSDERLKTDFLSFTDRSQNVLGLGTYQYTWKDTGADDFGVIAQEVEEVFPELVITGEDGYKAVDYAQLVVPLLEVTKQQQAHIDQLQADIRELQAGQDTQ